MKTLLSHQLEDAAYLARYTVAGNFSGMGSGKTLTALNAVAMVRASCALIVAPPIALYMWAAEAEAALSCDVQIVLTGTEEMRPEASVLIMSYAIAAKRAEELKGMGIDVLICDESHALKTWDAKRTQALFGPKGLAKYVTYVWPLTGTPVVRWNDDLYPFLLLADPEGMRDRCGGTTPERFQLRYCITQLKKFHSRQRYPKRVVVGNRNTDELRQWIFDPRRPLAVRRELSEVWAAMPPLTQTRLTVPLAKSEEVRAALAGLKKMSQWQIDQALSTNEESMAKMRRVLGTAKVPAAVSEIGERLEAADSAGILVGAWHRDVIDATLQQLKDAHPGRIFAKIDGTVSKEKRKAIQDGFNDGSIDCIVGQIAAMGVAIDLQHGGHNVLIIEEDWSPAIMDQFYARMLRMGQANHVHVDILSGDNGLDKAISRIAAQKAAEHTKIMKQG